MRVQLLAVIGVLVSHVEAHCEVAPDCSTCLSGKVGVSCGWCAINTTTKTKEGPQCADLTKSFDCNIEFQTDKCSQGWKCAKKTIKGIEQPAQCVPSVGGISIKSKCEEECSKPPPPPPPPPPGQAYSCNQTTLQCIKADFGDPTEAECKAHCKVTYICDDDAKACKKSTPGAPGTQYDDNATCAQNCPAKPQPVPYELRGIWRGFAIHHTYTEGEWVANITANSVAIWHPDAPSASYKAYIMGSATAFQHMGQYSILVDSSSAKLTGKVRILAADFSMDPEVGGFVQLAINEKTPQAEPKTFDAAMPADTVLSFETCPQGGIPPPSPPPKPPPKPPPPPPIPTPCKAKLDVVVILDGSNSIVTADWQRDLSFTNKLVDGFNISAEQVEVGVVQFSSTADTVIGLSADATAIHSAISSTAQMKMNTNTYAGFEQAQNILDAHGRKDNKGQLVILITDGKQNRGLPASLVSDALKAKGVQVFGIGVGRSIDAQEIQSWVSTPLGSHYFEVTGFDKLETILQKIVADACPHPPLLGVDYLPFGSSMPRNSGKNCKFHLPGGLPARRQLLVDAPAPRLPVVSMFGEDPVTWSPAVETADVTDECNAFGTCPQCIGNRAGGKTCGWCTGDISYKGAPSKFHCAGKDDGTKAPGWTCNGHYQTSSCDEPTDCGLDGIYRGLRIDNGYTFGEWTAAFTKETGKDDLVVIKGHDIGGKVTSTTEGKMQCTKKCSEGTTTTGVPFTLTTTAGDILHGICGYTTEVQAETSGLMWAISNKGVATPPADFDTPMLNTNATVFTYYRCSQYKKSLCTFTAP